MSTPDVVVAYPTEEVFVYHAVLAEESIISFSSIDVIVVGCWIFKRITI